MQPATSITYKKGDEHAYEKNGGRHGGGRTWLNRVGVDSAGSGGGKTAACRSDGVQPEAHQRGNGVAGTGDQCQADRKHGRADLAASARQPACRPPGAAGLPLDVHGFRWRFASELARPGGAGHPGALEWPPPVVLRRASRFPDHVRQYRRDSRRRHRAHGNFDGRRLGRVWLRCRGRRHQRDHQKIVSRPGSARQWRVFAQRESLWRAPGQRAVWPGRPGQRRLQHLWFRERLPARPHRPGRHL